MDRLAALGRLVGGHPQRRKEIWSRASRIHLGSSIQVCVYSLVTMNGGWDARNVEEM